MLCFANVELNEVVHDAECPYSDQAVTLVFICSAVS